MLILAYLFVLHFVADFILQSREMGKKKSSEPSYLAQHIFIQIYVFTLGLLFIVGPGMALTFALLNGIVHAAIDWNIWRAYKFFVWRKLVKKYEDKYPDRKEAAPNYAKVEAMSYQYWEDHWFYTTIGLDQLLHALTIILLFSLFI